MNTAVLVSSPRVATRKPMTVAMLLAMIVVGLGTAFPGYALDLVAFTGLNRVPALPDIPTFAELGHKQDAFTVSGWLGVAATGGTPAAVVNQLGAEISKALQTREVNARVLMAGFVPPSDDSPQKYQADWKRELPIWKQLLKDAGVEPT